MRKFVQRAALSLGLLVLWVAVPIGLIAGAAYLVSQYPPVTIATTRDVVDHSWDDLGYASASGTWVMENNEIGSPQNSVNILCRREMGICVESVAEIFGGGGNERILTSRTEIFSIDRWDSDSISYSHADGCIRYSVTINRRTESVTAQREPDHTGSATYCVGSVVVREDVLRTSLQDGWPVQMRLERDAASRTLPWLWLGLGLWLIFVGRQLWRIWRPSAGRDRSAQTP